MIVDVVKMFSEEDHRDNFKSGNIIIRSKEYYRFVQNKAQDQGECNRIANDILILCFHKQGNYDKTKYGRLSIEIKEIETFFDFYKK